MNCEQVKTVIPRYLAGESQESEAVAIEEHLAGCDHCAADLEADRQIDASLRAAMLEEEIDASSVIRRAVARMEHVMVAAGVRCWHASLRRSQCLGTGVLGCGTPDIRPSVGKRHCHGGGP